jgi:HAD superfamily hydrolase (TIGR01490 family)
MKLAIFDFDGTLFPKDTLPFLLSQWKTYKGSQWAYYKIVLWMIPLFLKYKMQIVTKMSREQMKVLAVKKFNTIFSDMTEQELIDFFAICSGKMIGLLNDSVVREVKLARSEGFHTVLLSGTYEYLLGSVGKFLEIDTVIGSKMNFTNGKFDPDIDPEIVIGQLKLKKVCERFANQPIDWQESRAYADGYSDLELLQAVGYPVAVNPEAKLEMIAQGENWKIIKDF